MEKNLIVNALYLQIFYINLPLNKETADLVDLQELYEMAGPSIFLGDIDVSAFIASIKNEDSVLVPPRVGFTDYVPSETAIWITEISEQFNMIDSYISKY